MTVGQNIKKYRKKAGYSQKELASKSGLSIGTIQGYEQERYIPKFDNLLKMAMLLKCTIEDLDPDINKRALNDNIDYDTLTKWIYSFDIDVEHPETLKRGTYKLVTEQNTKRLLNNFELLNQIGQQEAIKRVGELTEIPKYKK